MDRDTIQELCSLSKLNLSEDQMVRAQEQITRLLGYFDMLQAVSTDEVEASPYPVAIPLRPRDDEAEPPLPPPISAMVTSWSYKGTRPSPPPSPTTPFLPKFPRTLVWPVCCPVMSALREGAQTGEPA